MHVLLYSKESSKRMEFLTKINGAIASDEKTGVSFLTVRFNDHEKILIFNIEDGASFNITRQSYFNAAQAIIFLDADRDLTLRLTDKNVYVYQHGVDPIKFLEDVYKHFHKNLAPTKSSHKKTGSESEKLGTVFVNDTKHNTGVFTKLFNNVKQKMEEMKIKNNQPDPKNFNLN